MTPALVLFDVDGTLINTRGAGRAAMITSMRAVYSETGPIDSFDFHGKTDPEIVRGLLRAAGRSDEVVEQGLACLWERYYQELESELAARNGKMFTLTGVVDLLDRLEADARFRMGLVTGNMERGARHKLAACGLADRFLFGAFGSDSERREDLPPIARDRAESALGMAFRIEDAVVVGDTPQDIRCARASGAHVLAVATGRHTTEDLAAHAPDAVLEDLADTDEVMRILLDG